MHVSYISLAFLAIGAIAAPAAPKPDNEFGDIAGGFPFNTVGSSSIEDTDEGFDDSFPSALDAMHQALAQKQQSAQSAQLASTSHPLVAKPTKAHPTANFPAPVVSQAPSQAAPVVSQAPVISQDDPAPTIPTTSHAVIPTPAKSSSASPSSSATPSPSASAAAGPLSGLVKGLPIVGGFVGGPLAGLGLRR
ncbi:unnamed protein product [Penicillium egyptiacum]|uniref:Uncharacterized protein n=1 Tax=Penicillium egyptiacum TaxID=1303716 RepID=A0A9W4P2E1_9EURO|nr:unnamed protein product [Penicillium egyptiacum]